MTDLEINVKKRMIMAAATLHNACMKSYKENRCKGCPFDVRGGCDLYGHPIEWDDKLAGARALKGGASKWRGENEC